MSPLIKVTIRYDQVLQEITGTGQDFMMMSSGAPFLMLLQSLFSEYPEIEKRYSPGMLMFSINGVPPKSQSLMLDGDEVWFGVV